MSSVRPVRVLLIAAGLGIVLGTGFAFHREAEDEKARQALEDGPEGLGASQFPPAAPVQTGRVTLAAVEGLPQYPGAFVRPVSTGEQLNVAWFSTQDSVEQVLSFYEKEFTAKGLIAVSYQYSATSSYAGYMDLDDHRMHLVSVMRQQNETLVFPSTSYPEKMLEGAAQPPSGVPTIAGAEGALAFDLGGGPEKRQVWLATYANQTVDEVVAAWGKGLTEKGWEVKRSEEQGETRLNAEGDEGAVQVAIRKEQDAKIAVYVTSSTARGAP